jgi:putative Mg2+ transporter-C (MgtC) family protein
MMPNDITLELFGPVPFYVAMGLQVTAAVLLGGIVGYDREKKMKAAGLKTNIMICLGATLYTIVSLLNLQEVAQVGPVDPNRVGAQIVSNVIGMTTAATIWVVAAIGYTIGIGYPVSAAIFSLTVLFVLKMINPVYRYIDGEKRDILYHIQVVSLSSVKRSIFELIKADQFEIDEIYEEEVDRKLCSLNMYLYSSPRSTEVLINDIKRIALVNKVSFHVVNREERSREP